MNVLDEILSHLTELESDLRRLRDDMGLVKEGIGVRRTRNVNDCARMLGVSPTWLYDRRYLLPNYGRSDFPEGSLRWTDTTFKAWIEEILRETPKGPRTGSSA